MATSSWTALADYGTTGTAAFEFTNAHPEHHGATETVWVKATSTSTVFARHTTLGSSWWAIQFGQSFAGMAASLASPGELPPEGTQVDGFAFPGSSKTDDWAASLSGGTTGSVEQWIQFIGTAWIDGQFIGTTIGPPSWHEDRPFHTCRVPFYRTAAGTGSGDDFDFRSVSYTDKTSPGVGVLQDESSAVDIGIVYKDPCVLRIVDAEGDATGTSCTGWWMVVSRYRVTPSGTSAPPASGPSDALGDIVAWYSATPEFRDDDVVGPFRPVANTQCILDTAGDVVYDVRYWLGTAGARVVPAAASGEAEDAVFLYYVVESGTAFLDVPVKDKAEMTDVHDADGFAAGVWARKVLLTDLAAALAEELATPGTWTDEKSWEDYPGAGTADADWPVVPGTLLGRIQVWAVSHLLAAVAAGETGTDLEDDSIEAKYVTSPGGLAPFWADPVPAVGDTGIGTPYFHLPALALFIAAIPAPGHGLAEYAGTDAEGFIGAWAAMALTPDQCAAYGLRFGLAFTVRADTSDGSGQDKIAGVGSYTDPDGTPQTPYRLDPDPLITDSATEVLVYLGEGLGGSSPGYLDVYSASYAEVFRDATSET